MPHFKYIQATTHNHLFCSIQNACDELFIQYNARENIDILHAVVTEARERQAAGIAPGPDTWRANLPPRTAVRARTIPILRNEKAALEAQLAKVILICALENHLSMIYCQLEEENLKLQGEMVGNSEAMEGNEAEEKRRLDLLDEVSWSEFDGCDRT